MRTPARVVLALALLAGLLLLAAGPGARFGLWHFSTGFAMLRWAAWLGCAVALVAALSLLFRRTRRANRGSLALALLVGAVVAATPLYWQGVARAAPPIHDISTDLVDPPDFVALAPIRADAPNSLVHGGEAVAEIQRQAYPDIEPIILPLEPLAAFERAAAAAREMGWQMVASEPETGRIEASARTFWFGFIDDVVIRVRAAEAGSRIDVRSVSRVGRGDAGANAQRIREYRQALGRLADRADSGARRLPEALSPALGQAA